MQKIIEAIHRSKEDQDFIDRRPTEEELLGFVTPRAWRTEGEIVLKEGENECVCSIQPNCHT